MPSNVLPFHLNQTFLHIIWIFTEGEEVESRLPFKIFCTLCTDFIILLLMRQKLRRWQNAKLQIKQSKEPKICIYQLLTLYVVSNIRWENSI